MSRIRQLAMQFVKINVIITSAGENSDDEYGEHYLFHPEGGGQRM